MKKKRRIEVVIERRQLSVVGISSPDVRGNPGGGAEANVNEDRAHGTREETPSRCATCGSTEMLPLSEAMALVAVEPFSPVSGVERSDVHCTFSTSEECWVCKPSLHLA